MKLGGSLEQASSDNDYKESVQWAEKAAAQGNADALWILALAHEHGVSWDKPSTPRPTRTDNAALFTDTTPAAGNGSHSQCCRHHCQCQPAFHRSTSPHAHYVNDS